MPPLRPIPARPIPASPDALRRPTRFDHALARTFLVVWTVLSFALLTARALHPGPETGEYWSDSNVINASRAFDNHGFMATYGIPRLETDVEPTDLHSLYLTYPPGPYWISYASWRLGALVGVDPLLAARLVSQAVGVLSGLLIFQLFTRLAGNPGLGGVAGLFYILSLPYSSYSADLHHMTYSPALLFGAMLAWLAFERGAGRRRWLWLLLTAFLYAVDCWTNLEHIVFFALFVAFRTLCCFRWPVILGAALVGPLPIPMMALRVAHNALLLGGWDASINRFRAAANRRSTGGRIGLDLHALIDAWLGRLGWPIGSAWNKQYQFPILDPWILGGIAAILASILLTVGVRRHARRRRHLPISLIDPAAPVTRDLLLPADPRVSPVLFWRVGPIPPIARGLLNGLLLLAGGFSWFIVMTQHTLPHRFIVLILMPGLSLLLGSTVYAALRSALSLRPDQVGPIARWARFRAMVLGLALLVTWCRHLALSDVLNQLLPLDATTAQRVAQLETRNRRTGVACDQLAAGGISRLVFFDGDKRLPWRAASTRLPYTFASIQMPESLAPDQALYVEAWDDIERDAVVQAAGRWGLPTFVGPIDEAALVFAPGASDADAWAFNCRLEPPIPLRTDVAAEQSSDANLAPAPAPALASDALLLEQMRWSRPLASDGAVLSMLVSGPLGPDGAGSARRRLVFTVRLLDDTGTARAERTVRIGTSKLRNQARAIISAEFSSAELSGCSTGELSIRDRRDRQPIRVPTELPAPLRATPEGTGLGWTLAP